MKDKILLLLKSKSREDIKLGLSLAKMYKIFGIEGDITKEIVHAKIREVFSYELSSIISWDDKLSLIVENYKDYLPVVFKEDDDKYKNNTLSLSEDGKIIYQATLELDMEKVFGEKIKGDVTFHGNSNKFRYSTTIKESEENKQIRYTTTIKEQEQK